MAASKEYIPCGYLCRKKGFLTILCFSVLLVALLWKNKLSLQINFPDTPCDGETCRGKKSWGNEPEKESVISAVGQTFQTWSNLSAPGTYRGCINFLDSSKKDLNMVQVEESKQMTVVRCINQCNKKVNTYVGLLGGTQCYCINFTGPSDSLHYVPTSQCSAPCSGDSTYNCGGRNSTFSLYRTKIPDSRCSEISLMPEGSMPLIALASFPRSGNTWTRRLLEHATGLYTRSIYWKSESRQSIGSKVFLGGNINYNTGSTLCIKTHLFDVHNVKEFTEGAILLLRNPYKAIVAEAFRKQMIAKDEGPERTIQFIKSGDWTNFVKTNAGNWLATAVNWCRNSKRLLVVNYEELQKNTSKELIRVVKFLDQPLNMTRIACAVQELPSSESTGVYLGNHGIKTRSYLTFDPFTKLLRKLLDGHIATVNATLIRYGHAPLPNYKEAKLLF